MKSLPTLLLTALVCVTALAASTREHTLLVFGDSLSAAYGIDEDRGWVSLLDERLKRENLPWRVVNGSVSGETTAGGLARLPALLEAWQPHLVVLELGGNDGLRGLPLDTLKQNLVQMIAMIRGAGAEVILAGIQIPPNYGPRYTLPFARLFSEIAEQEQVVLVPFLLEGIPQRPELMQRDGIHPVAAAQPMIVDNVWPWLEPLLERLPATPQD